MTAIFYHRNGVYNVVIHWILCDQASSLHKDRLRKMTALPIGPNQVAPQGKVPHCLLLDLVTAIFSAASVCQSYRILTSLKSRFSGKGSIWGEKKVRTSKKVTFRKMADFVEKKRSGCQKCRFLRNGRFLRALLRHSSSVQQQRQTRPAG